MMDYFDHDDKESIDLAYDELKRADHLIFVSLKYTRTVDVIKNIITRFLNFFDYIIDTLLEKLLNEKEIDSLPQSPGMKVELVKQYFSNDEIISEYLDFYMLLRKIQRSEYLSDQEYRRYVKMSICLNDNVIEIDIDKINEYYNYIKNFYRYIKQNYVLQ